MRILQRASQTHFHVLQTAQTLRRVQRVDRALAAVGVLAPHADVADAARLRPQRAQRLRADARRAAEGEREQCDVMRGHANDPLGARVCALSTRGRPLRSSPRGRNGPKRINPRVIR